MNHDSTFVTASTAALLLTLGSCGGGTTPPTQSPGTVAAPSPAPNPSEVSAILGDARRYKVDGEGRPCVGPADAVVTIVEYEDFACPFTRRAEAVVQKLIAAHPTDMRICFRHEPIAREHSMLAAQASEEVFIEKGAQAFYELRADLLRENLSKEKVVALAQKHGADSEALAAAIGDERHAEAVKRDQAMLLRTGYHGTPTFFINGRFIQGARHYEEFAEVVDDEVKRGQELVRHGTPPAALFSTIMAHGLEKGTQPTPRPAVR